MTQKEYEEIENYMTACLHDSAHDREHVYRVLYDAGKERLGEIILL